MRERVFLALVHTAGRVRTPEPLRPYLFGIALRQVAQELRRRRRKRWLVLLPTDQLPGDAEPRHQEADPAVEALRRVLTGVSERQQHAFWLRFVEELSPSDVGAALAISESTAKREIARARERVLRLARQEPALARYLERREGASR